MCGIAGGLFWNGATSRDAAEQAVSRMVTAIAHRGPDGRGLRVVSSATENRTDAAFVVFGHTRLAILDLSTAAGQPMGDPGGSSITYNGETYNFAELKSDLERAGVRFTTTSDTEVVLRGYDVWGVDVVDRLRGMFAFAIWDPRESRLLLARDRVGIKPLYYYRGDGCLLFASEVRALLASELVPRQLDAVALWQYLGYQSIPAPRTLVEGVRMLEPAHYATIAGDGTWQTRAYWTMLGASNGADPGAATEVRRRVGDLLAESVAAHMVSDVPVGAFLSGGIDSSAIVALMRQGGWQPRTFSVGFAEQAFDESEHARLVASRYGADHTEVRLSEHDLLESLPDALAAMDQPTGDGVNTYIVSRAVRARGITVALSGLGGDELFGGYPSFSRLQRAVDLSRLWAGWPAPMRSFAAATVRTFGSSIGAQKAAAVMETDGSLASMFPVTRQVLSEGQRQALLSPALLEQITERDDPYDGLLADAYDRAPGAGFFARVSFAEARTYMHDVLLRDTDQMSMAHALEVRVPFLDHRVVEYVTSLPDSVKASNGVPKKLLLDSLPGLVPAEVAERPKQGFTLPFDVWMRGALRPFCEAHLGAGSVVANGLMRPDAVGSLWQSFLAGRRDVSWSRLWVIAVLDAWLQRVGGLA